MVLFFALKARHLIGNGGLVEDAAEVQAAGFPVRDALARVEQVYAANEIVETADA